LTFYANFVVLGELFNHMCGNYGYGLKKSAEKQNSELLNKPPFNQKNLKVSYLNDLCVFLMCYQIMAL